MTEQKRKELMKLLNWDYSDKPSDMLLVIEGVLDSSGAFDRDKLFLRSLENLPWHLLVQLWGKENIKELYTEETAGRIYPKERRKHYDYAVGLLRGDPLPHARWGDEHFSKMQQQFLSNRWDGFEQGVL